MQHPKTRGGTTGSNSKSRTSGPKAIDHRWQRAPTSENKRVGRVPELELQLAQLQEELKKTKDELNQSESRTKLAKHEAEQAKKQLAVVTAKLDESQKQLDELWACEEARIQELRKISQERDRAWESELKAVQKHLTTAITENQKLNIRLQKAAEFESAHAKQAESAQDEILTLKLELSETEDVIKELKTQLNESESREMEIGCHDRAVEIEGELSRLKVQTEQWRKAAEVAAAMVLAGDGGGGGGGSFCEDESSMKKTSNMLKKIGVLLKKGQK